MGGIYFYAHSLERSSRAFLPIVTPPSNLEKLNLGVTIPFIKTFVRRRCRLVSEGLIFFWHSSHPIGLTSIKLAVCETGGGDEFVKGA